MDSTEKRRVQTNRETTRANGTANPSQIQPSPTQEKAVPVTRVGTIWVAAFFSMLALVVVLVFILQNLTTVRAHFFAATWKIPLGVDLLLAAILGGIVVAFLGAVRIFQLRRLAHRRHLAVLQAAASAQSPSESGTPSLLPDVSSDQSNENQTESP